MVHVGMGEVERPRRLPIVLEIGGQRIGTAIDHQQRLAVALDDGAGRAELDRLGVADAEETQGQGHRRSPRA